MNESKATSPASTEPPARVRPWTGLARIRERALAALTNEEQIFLALTLVIGAIVGLAVVAFIVVTENLAIRMYPRESPLWRRLAIPVIGSLVAGYLLHRFAPEARGSGVPQTKAALYARGGFIALRTVLAKFFLTAITLASGIPLGREGPSVQVGSGIASVLGRKLRLSQERVKALIPVGAAAAVAAAFNTPLAAVLFALEEITGNLHAPLLGSVVLSATSSWLVLRLSLGNEPLFHVPEYRLVHPVEFLFYAALGILGGLLSVAFVKLLLRTREWFLGQPERGRWALPIAGGLLVGVVGLAVPEVLGVGYTYVGLALNNHASMTLGLMALLVMLKLVTVTTAYGSGNAGGIFGPSLFLGAMFGGALGSILHSQLPALTAPSGAYALVGMGALFAGIVRAPMTSVIMIFEVTRDYQVIVPLMLANLMSLYVSRRLQPTTVYEALSVQDGIHLPTAQSREQSGTRSVRLAMRVMAEMLSPQMTVRAALERGRRSEFHAWPVRDQHGLCGMATAAELQKLEAEGKGEAKLGDFLDPRHFPHVHSDQSLELALERMGSAGLDLLPVVSRANVRELEGVVALADVMQAYGLHSLRVWPGRHPSPGEKPQE